MSTSIIFHHIHCHVYATRIMTNCQLSHFIRTGGASESKQKGAKGKRGVAPQKSLTSFFGAAATATNTATSATTTTTTTPTKSPIDQKQLETLNQLPSDVSYFPKKVAKKKPREVLVSVAVLRTTVRVLSVDGGGVGGEEEGVEVEKYLFVRRPTTGTFVIVSHNLSWVSLLSASLSHDYSSSCYAAFCYIMLHSASYLFARIPESEFVCSFA
jgi:hypothetical protein